ncbi:MAG: cytochrome b/b6 domain-containing protein [Rhodanobacter sp.]
MNEQPSTLLRHAGGVRLAHLALAAAIGWFILSGLGIHESLSARVIHVLGGHVVLVASHRWLGYALGAALLLALIFLRHRVHAFLSAIWRFQRSDVAWLPRLLRSLLRPRTETLSWHDGRFDPIQRLVFLILVCSLTLLVVTGVAINFIHASSARVLFVWTLRTHLATAWVFMAAVSVHIFAGIGVLPTHRGVTRAMFGDGRIKIDLSHRLWPGWTQRQLAATELDPNTARLATTVKAADPER